MPRTVVICLGNPLMGDDGVGPTVLARLRHEWRLDGVELVDGGTWGLSLLPVIEDAGRLVLVDAIVAHGAPGDIVELSRERLPIYLSRKLSPHQVDMRDALAVAELRGRLPADIVAIGVHPRTVALGLELSAPVAASLDGLVQALVAQLERWGHTCVQGVSVGEPELAGGGGGAPPRGGGPPPPRPAERLRAPDARARARGGAGQCMR